MALEFKCPTCGSRLKAPLEYAGKAAKCKQCSSTFTIPTAEPDEVMMVSENIFPANPQPSYREQLKQFQFPPAILGRRIDDFSERDAQALFEWGMRMYGLSSNTEGTIEEIKYEGHVVILEDGSRWEVDDSDTYTSDSWLEGDRVVVIDGRMYQLDESESVQVREL